MPDKSPSSGLPPDAPEGAVCQLNGGIFVDANGQEVRPPRAKAEAPGEAPPGSAPASPDLDAYLAPRIPAATDLPPGHEG